jgi:hypothetical protein
MRKIRGKLRAAASGTKSAVALRLFRKAMAAMRAARTIAAVVSR